MPFLVVLKTYGFDEVLKPLLDDLKKLASDDGYYFTVGNSTIYIRGAVSVFCGDTPASKKELHCHEML